MAKNIEWIRNQYPDEKIIGWAATSHILSNASHTKIKGIPGLLVNKYYKKHLMMGDYLRRRYPHDLFTIGFLAGEGYFGFEGFGRKRRLKYPRTNSLEFILMNTKYENVLLPLEGMELSGLLSRPLGNLWMKNDISEVLDAIIFNKYMERPQADIPFILELFPNWDHLKKRLDASKKKD